MIHTPYCLWWVSTTEKYIVVTIFCFHIHNHSGIALSSFPLTRTSNTSHLWSGSLSICLPYTIILAKASHSTCQCLCRQPLLPNITIWVCRYNQAHLNISFCLLTSFTMSCVGRARSLGSIFKIWLFLDFLKYYPLLLLSLYVLQLRFWFACCRLSFFLPLSALSLSLSLLCLPVWALFPAIYPVQLSAIITIKVFTELLLLWITTFTLRSFKYRATTIYKNKLHV